MRISLEEEELASDQNGCRRHHDGEQAEEVGVDEHGELLPRLLALALLVGRAHGVLVVAHALAQKVRQLPLVRAHRVQHLLGAALVIGVQAASTIDARAAPLADYRTCYRQRTTAAATRQLSSLARTLPISVFCLFVIQQCFLRE